MSKKDLYYTLSKSAKSHPLLHHYTSICSCEKITDNSSIKLNQLSLVNDPDENRRITSLWNGKVFVGCFTNTFSNEDYFWIKYGEVRLSINPRDIEFSVFADPELKIPLKNFQNDYNSRSCLEHKSYDKTSDWCVLNGCIADVFYTDNLNDHLLKDGTESNAGLIKVKNGYDRKTNQTINWEIESETRIRVAVRPIGKESYLNKEQNDFNYFKPSFSELYIPLPKRIIDLSLSPYSTEKSKKEFDSLKNNLINKGILKG